MLAAGLLAATGAADAQITGWEFNEFGRSTGAAAGRGQFIELYHPVPNQSVDGLSIITVRTFVTPPYMFAYRTDLTGTANGNFFVVANANYSNPPEGTPPTPAPADFTAAGDIHRPNGIEEFYLVPTASIDPSWTVSTAAGSAYRFDGTEFDNGNQIIDKAYRISQADSNTNGRWIDVATEQDKFIGWTLSGSEGPGAYREGDSGPWITYEFPPSGNFYPSVPNPISPGAPNPETPPPPPPPPVLVGTETFEGLLAVAPSFVDGTPTLSDSAIFQERTFGGAPPPAVVNNASAAFSGSRFIQWGSANDSILEIVEADGMEGTDETIQLAFALRIDSALEASPNSPFNNIDLFLLTTNTGGSSGGAQLAGLRALDGELRMAVANGFGGVVVSEDAFNGASPNNWADQQWRVLVARITPSTTPGEPSVKWWVVDPDTGDTEVLVDIESLTDEEGEPAANVRTNIVRRIGFGATERGAQLPWFPQVSVDDFGFFSLTEFPTEFDLFTEVYENYVSPFQRPAPVDGTLSFGIVPIDGTETLTYTVTNEGTQTTTLTGASFASGEAGYSVVTGFPVDIPGRGSVDITIQFDSVLPEGPRVDMLTLTTSAPSVPALTVEVNGFAGAETTVDDWRRY